jgi:hypothetical protein
LALELNMPSEPHQAGRPPSNFDIQPTTRLALNIFPTASTFGSWRTGLWLFLIILLGFGIRFTGVTWGQAYSNFSTTDSLAAYSFTVDYALGDPRAQYIGQPNYNEHSKVPGPLWSLFCFIGLRSWGSVEGIVLLILLLNTATIYLTYLLTERTLGPPYSFWAALLAATLPFPVYYSNFVYNPNVMPFLGALFFLVLWDVTQKDFSRSIFWLGVLFLAMPQFHLSGLSLLSVAILVLALSSTRLNVRWLVAGIMVGTCFYIPYIRGEMAHGWENTLNMTSGRNGHWWGGLKALVAPWNFLINYVPQWTHSETEYRQLGKECFGWFGILVILNIVSAVIAILLLVRAFGESRKAMHGLLSAPRQTFQRSPGILFLTIIIVVPLFQSLISRQSFHSRYAIVVLPALLALVSYALVQWLASPRFGRMFAIAIVVMTCGNLWFMPAMYYRQNMHINQGEVFLASFRHLESLYQQLKIHAGINRCVRVDDVAYRKTLDPKDKLQGEAKHISGYVKDREKEFVAATGIYNEPVIYTLLRADQVNPGDRAVAYCTNGVALVASQSARQD